MALRDQCSRVVGRVRRWPRRVLITIAVIALLLVAARIALPYVVERQVNARLSSIPGYTGHVADVDIALIRGAYAMEGVSVFKTDGAAREPFFSARHLDFSLAWRELFRGKIVSEIYAEAVEVHLVAAGTKEESQRDIDRRWQDVVKDLFPIDITHFEVRDGFIAYRDLTRQPVVDLFVKDMHVRATGLRNRPDETGDEFPAKIHIEGESLGGGHVELFVQAEPLAPQPHFHLAAKVDGVHLPALNESLKAIANVDVRRGTFQLAAEMAGRDGGFQGYVKPFFNDLDFDNVEDSRKPILARVWENIVQGIAWLVKNKSRDQVGTRIPFQGRFGDPQLGLWATIQNLFRHGFVRAFNPTIEGSVDPDNVLPTGDTAKGPPVAEVKTDSPAGGSSNAGAGAPTGRAEKPRR